ncbi:hypothetical protein IQ03_03747 [Gemmobacter caeni]|uniref:Uncharacterized protein n=1 Tax=Gemmobacter caeni TaxID=589035 RepID=A0A2T6ARE8_9RHOB|nr:hypothetical protein [Gemmobacter caeni]PTX46316.1 hypothetical protein C8N34_1174 [Gemmobacter caeni]TWI95148.1 hypothetical protein IQ03_03747 [Gemmobacter caeni]
MNVFQETSARRAIAQQFAKQAAQIQHRAVMLNGMIEAADVLFDDLERPPSRTSNSLTCLLAYLCDESHSLAAAIEALEDALNGKGDAA